MLIGFRDYRDTFRTFDAVQRHFDHLFDWAPVTPVTFAAPARVARRAAAHWPAVNVAETKEAYVYQAEVPGLAEGDVHVQVEAGALVLRGERKNAAPEGYETHLRERAPITFARKLPLPGRVDAEAVTATLKDGVLTVTLPKAKEALPRLIAVKAL